MLWMHFVSRIFVLLIETFLFRQKSREKKMRNCDYIFVHNWLHLFMNLIIHFYCEVIDRNCNYIWLLFLTSLARRGHYQTTEATSCDNSICTLLMIYQPIQHDALAGISGPEPNVLWNLVEFFVFLRQVQWLPGYWFQAIKLCCCVSIKQHMRQVASSFLFLWMDNC